jgi:hypothetical protein
MYGTIGSLPPIFDIRFKGLSVYIFPATGCLEDAITGLHNFVRTECATLRDNYFLSGLHAHGTRIIAYPGNYPHNPSRRALSLASFFRL